MINWNKGNRTGKVVTDYKGLIQAILLAHGESHNNAVTFATLFNQYVDDAKGFGYHHIEFSALNDKLEFVSVDLYEYGSKTNISVCIDFTNPEAKCMWCGGKNITWFAENKLWNEVTDNPPGLVICPQCFQELADEKKVNSIFKAMSVADSV